MKIFLSLVALALLLFFAKKRSYTHSRTAAAAQPPPTASEPLPYQRKLLLNKSEYRLYSALKPLADAKNYLICPKVSLKNMFRVTENGFDRMSYVGKLNQRYVDFLICDSNLNPLFAVNLIGQKRSDPDRQNSEAFVKELFSATNTPLRCVPETSNYTEAYIKTHIPELC